jgi:hypothetical protein
MDELLGALQQIDPLWSVVLVAVALAILVVARLWRASFLKVLAGFVALAVVGGLGGAAYYGYLHLEDSRRIEERRVLEERAAALFSRAVEPESVFACIDGSPVPAMQEGCERTLFAEPQRVAAAVAIVTQRLSFLDDALDFAERDPSYLERIEPIRKAAEADPYGFVAFVLSVEHQCSADSCKRFQLLRDPTQVRENMRVRRLEAYMARYSANWRGSTDAAPIASKPTSAPLITISEPAGAPAKAETKEAASQPTQAEKPAGEPAADSRAADAPSPQAPAPLAPVAASAPIITPPADAAAKEAPRPAAAGPAAASPAAAKQPEAAAAKGAAQPRPPSQPQARPAGQPKTKASADPVSRRTNEPVAGLPRVVPSEYIRDKEEKEKEEAAEPTTQAAGRPATPAQVWPQQQNFR